MNHVINSYLIEGAPAEMAKTWTAGVTAQIEDAWAEGLEVFAIEEGFILAHPGAMQQYKVASA